MAHKKNQEQWINAELNRHLLTKESLVKAESKAKARKQRDVIVEQEVKSEFGITFSDNKEELRIRLSFSVTMREKGIPDALQEYKSETVGFFKVNSHNLTSFENTPQPIVAPYFSTMYWLAKIRADDAFRISGADGPRLAAVSFYRDDEGVEEEVEEEEGDKD